MKFKLRRPTVEMPFHVDWSWFERNNFDVDRIVWNQLCDDCQQQFGNDYVVEEVDYIEPETGEVSRVDTLREAILAHCQWLPDYINEETPLVQSVLRLFLANNNKPLSSQQIAQRLQRHDADAILRVLTAGGVQSGIVPMR
jgi:hypothetical protein